MLKFFRHIRQNLLAENKTGKYLKYAIGEIVLVVIGILIALQINNWNDHRKTQKYEQEILSLINQNLKSDSIALSIELQKAKDAILTTDLILEQVSNDKYNDSLKHWLAKIICFERFRAKSSAFEVLKAKGIETISENTIQQELIAYYDESLYNVYQAMEDVESAFNLDWVPILKSDFKDFQWRVSCEPIDSKAFFTKPSTITQIKLFNDNRKGNVRHIESALIKITEIRHLIKVLNK
ncbi:hypothetical protein C1T31_05240 [Hanstruepera neustonica]|uniref:Uncharacterized protein n=1 Tax=Hanstruepera neustonica TaxID=1445657 RepID=A0A2K1E0C4_9FLAO|nr:DUF6090 family protein [Hanstruepera neustonica]PNQ73740.1 hypothetical protein C1T31_05240 [Hanstruepera neustonica]